MDEAWETEVATSVHDADVVLTVRGTPIVCQEVGRPPYWAMEDFEILWPDGTLVGAEISRRFPKLRRAEVEEMVLGRDTVRHVQERAEEKLRDDRPTLSLKPVQP